MPANLVPIVSFLAATSPWAQMATEDLSFIRETLAANHPGAVDVQNREFSAWLDDGYLAASALASAAQSPGDVTAALSKYIAGFADGHLGVYLDFVPRTLQWPGFTVGLRAGRWVVVETDGDSTRPRTGDELVRCDGRAPDEILTRDVLPFLDGRVSLAAIRTRQAPRLLVGGDGIPRSLPERCEFKCAGTLSLDWTVIERTNLMAKVTAAAFGAPPPFAVEETEPGRYWISLPTFSPKSGAEEDALRAAIGAVSGMRAAKSIVLDVRGNGGGSSQWGDDIIQSLFGDDMLRAAGEQVSPENCFAEWRVSRANYDYLVRILPDLTDRFGKNSSMVLAFKKLASNLEAALVTGQTFVRQPPSETKRAAGPLPKSPVTAKVVLLTDGRCASACLDFADLLRAIPGVVHAGTETSADTSYMEVRDVPLPSGFGSLGFAMKVYRNRARGNNEPYAPRWTYEGNIGDSAAVKAWIREQVLPETSGVVVGLSRGLL